jgi:putative oxidoreductase
MGIMRDFFAFTGRLGLAAVLLAHGLQKFLQWGIPGTITAFAQMGVPAPQIAAWFSAVVEVVGAVSLIIGLAMPLFGILIALEMAGALYFVDVPHGPLQIVTFEALLVGTGALALGFNGGRWSLDYALVGRKRGRHERNKRNTLPEI